MEPAPEGAHGPAGESGQVINGRNAKLKHIVQKLDVTVLEFKSVFRGHGWISEGIGYNSMRGETGRKGSGLYTILYSQTFKAENRAHRAILESVTYGGSMAGTSSNPSLSAIRYIARSSSIEIKTIISIRGS